jgi:hypothetical protein
MKVATDLKAGGFLQDASYEANKAVKQVSGYVNEAAREADNLTKTVSSTVSSVWNALSSSLNL